MPDLLRLYLGYLGVEALPRPAALAGAAPVRDGVTDAPAVPAAAGLPKKTGAAGTAPVGRKEALDALRSEMGDCRRCALAACRSTIVFGTGDPEARLLFVGEAPGEEEDLQGEPFVGAAGRKLNDMIRAMGLERSEVYICNVVKCRPPGNRDPLPEEAASCRPFLKRQLQIVSPRVICALGRHAAQAFLGADARIGRVRGTFHDHEGIPLMPTYHPAYLLRNPASKREAWEDLKKIMNLLGLPIPKGK